MANISSSESQESSQFEEVFKKIRINFLFNHPFLSVLALSIPTSFEKNPNSAFTTNGSSITIDLEKLALYSEDEIVYLYAHTLLHIVLKHPFRSKQRDKKLWNQASDIVINLIMDSFSNVGVMPGDEIFDAEFKDKCVEEVYEILEKEEKEENEDSGSDDEDEDSTVKTTPDKNGDKKAHIYNENKMDLDTVPDESKNSGDMEKLDGIIIQALTIAQKTSNKYAGMNIEINTLIKPEINLHDILKEYLISSFFEKQNTFNRPNRKFISQGLYLPGTKKSDELIELYIALDSSSSVSMDEYKKFLGIVSEVCEGFYEYKITILPFDKYVKTEHITEFDSFNPIEDEKLFIPKSDGGTNFNEVLRYLKTTDIRADKLLMVLTDGEFEINENIVCQTLFIISSHKNLEKFKSYGRVIEFNL